MKTFRGYERGGYKAHAREIYAFIIYNVLKKDKGELYSINDLNESIKNDIDDSSFYNHFPVNSSTLSEALQASDEFRKSVLYKDGVFFIK